MKNFLKSFFAGRAAKVMFLSLALTGAMGVLNAQTPKDPNPGDKNKCEFNGQECPPATSGCVCD
jgi:hypothetical protein